MSIQAVAVARDALASTTAAASPLPNATTANGAAASAPASSTSVANQTLGATEFLSLLTTELKNQDPLNPIDSTQSIAQLAQFSSLQATTNLSTNFSTFQSNFAVTQASGLLGEKVAVATADAGGNSSTISGTVATIEVVNGAPQFTMVDAKGNPIADSHGNPIAFKTSQITGITK